MKGIIMLVLLFAAGCSAYVPLEQLEAEALVSGDWSKVEQREMMLQRRQSRSVPSCPPGTMAYCNVGIGRDECTCVDNEIISSFLER